MSTSAPNISFEFFPPSSLDASFRLWDSVRQLSPLDPNFVSVTYGAGGATRETTHEALKTLITHFGLNVAGHLTCVDASRDETLAIAKSYARAGVKEIVALRGDPPAGARNFTPSEDGFKSSVELVEGLAALDAFKIRVAAYVEPHPESRSDAEDIALLKAKFDAGADSAITQYFYDVEAFLRFRDRADKAGITGKIIPGLLPIHDWDKVKSFSKRCGAQLPEWMDAAFAKAKIAGLEDLLSISILTELCSDLMDEGVEDIHFYTLNRPDLTRTICKALGIEPFVELRQVA